MFGPHEFPADRTLTFDLRSDGRAILARNILSRNDDWKLLVRRERRICATATILFMVVLPLTVWSTSLVARSQHQAYLIGVSLSIGAFTSLQFYRQFRRSTAWVRALKKAAARPGQKVMRTQLTLAPEGIWFGHPKSSILLNWSKIDRVAIVEDGVGVFGNTPQEQLFIGAEAFSSDEARATFVSDAVSLHRASGSMGPDLVVKRLANEHVLCDRCGQDLYGIPEPRCPECGRELTASSFQYLEMARTPWTKELARRMRIFLLGS